MKLYHKLILGYLLIASFAGITAFTALRSYKNINEGFERLMREPDQVISLLSKLKHDGGGIADSTKKIIFIYAESAFSDSRTENEFLSERELQLMESAHNDFRDSLRQIEQMADAADRAELFAEIGKTGDEFLKSGSQLIELKKKGIAGKEILVKREEFEKNEAAYLKAVDAALMSEHKKFAGKQAGIMTIISDSERATLIITLLAFILAIGAGLYISRQIVKRIVELKKASEMVGRGELDTFIGINSKDEIGDLARSFNKMVSDLRAFRADLAANKNFTDKVLNSMVDFVVVTDLNLNITQVNKAALDINGYEEAELIGKSSNILSGDRPFTQKDIDILRKRGQITNLDSMSLNKDGSLTPVSMSFSVFKDDQGSDLGIVSVGKDISERRREETEREIVNEIMRSVMTASNLEELFETAHRSISRLIYTENCFIALHNQADGLMHFEFWADKFDPVPPPSPIGKSFTSHIMRTGEPLLLNEELEREMYRRGDVEKTGTDSPSWMGVPLRLDSRTIGVLAVQHYEESDIYSPRDLELLSMVADRLALAVEYKKTEVEFKSSEMQLREAEQIARLGSWQWDLAANKVSWSDGLYKIFGFQPQEFQPSFEAFLECMHPDDRKIPENVVENALKENIFRSFDHRIIRPDGSIRILQSGGKVIVDKTGRPVKMVGTSQDITDQRQTEKELARLHVRIKDQNQRLNDIISNMPGIVWEINVEPDGKTQNVDFVSEQITNMLGYSVEEWLAVPNFWLTIVHPEDRAGVEREAFKNFAEGKSCILEFRWITKDGRVIWVESRSEIICGGDDQPVGLRGVTLDISERKKAEQEMERLNLQIESQHQRLHDLFDDVPCVIWESPLDSNDNKALNNTSQLGFINGYVTKMFGYTTEEWFSKPDFWLSIVHPDDREKVFRDSDRLFSEGQVSIQVRWITKDDRTIWGETNIVVVRDKKGQPVGLRGVTTDITRRKETEEILRNSEEQHRLLFETNPQPSFIYDLETLEFLAVNDAAVRHYGFSREEFLDTITVKDIRPPEDVARFLEKVAKVTPDQDIILSPSRHLKKDGSVRDVEVTSHMLVFNGRRAEIVLINDVTERREAEEQLKIFNEKLQQSNRELQDFAYVASHDLQEPLRKVQAFADRLGTKYSGALEGGGLDYLERMKNAAARMQTLIQDLLAFSRVTTKAQPFVPVDLDKITREVLSDLEVKIEETGATVDIGNLPTIAADPLQMRQLMQNLVGNALKFRRPGAAPLVKVSAEPFSNGNGKNGAYRIFVRDNGIGFEEKYLDKIFTVFQRLHGRAEYEGSGVGLAICRKIAERHRGEITAQSKPGEGTTFIITLPLEHKNN